MVSSPLPLLASFTILCLTTVKALAVVTVVNKHDIVMDPSFHSEANHPELSQGTRTDEEGFVHETIHGTTWREVNRHYTHELGEATEVSSNSRRFDSDYAERMLHGQEEFQFNSTTAIQTHFLAQGAIAKTGNFSVIVSYAHLTSINYQREFQFVLDGPMRLEIHLSGATSNPEESFKNIFNSLRLSAGRFNIPDQVYMLLGNGINNEDLSKIGSRMGVDYVISGFAGEQGLDIVMDLTPSEPGTSQTLDFRWLLKHELNGGKLTSATRWSQDVTADLQIRESLRLTRIPEPVLAALVLPGFLALWRRSRGEK